MDMNLRGFGETPRVEYYPFAGPLSTNKDNAQIITSFAPTEPVILVFDKSKAART
jgi:hypothetical protein